MFACPICKEKVNGVTNLRIHITCCKSNPIEVQVKRSIGSPSSVTSLEESGKDFQMINRNLQQANKPTKPMAQNFKQNYNWKGRSGSSEYRCFEALQS